jgi:hypothetical protein
MDGVAGVHGLLPVLDEPKFSPHTLRMSVLNPNDRLSGKYRLNTSDKKVCDVNILKAIAGQTFAEKKKLFVFPILLVF